jgi:hypothetical protein
MHKLQRACCVASYREGLALAEGQQGEMHDSMLEVWPRVTPSGPA